MPGAPGRVVTLLPEPRAACWGIAYRVARDVAADVLSDLEVRERGGYERHDVTLHLPDPSDLREGGEPSDAARLESGLVWVATPRNPNYLGPAPLDAIAEQVLGSRGPSGANVEYVLSLAEALHAIDADDPHVFALAEIVRRRGASPPPSAARAGPS